MAITICDSCELRRICLDKNKFYPVVKCQNYHEGEAIMVEQTNEEWLRQSTTEQLTEAILQQWIHGAYHGVGEFGLTDKEIELSREDIADWLKQPHNP